jgi:hypothetical protein
VAFVSPTNGKKEALVTRNEALRLLTKCEDETGKHWSGGFEYTLDDCPTCHGTNEAGWLGTPGSRYGYNARECAPAAYRAAQALGEQDNEDTLNSMMGLAVNDHDDIEFLIRELPHPERYL